MGQREYESFKNIFDSYLMHNGVKSFRPFRNRKARLDGTLTSGNTEHCFEYKQRFNKDGSMMKFEQHDSPATFLEKDKYESLMCGAKILASKALYIVEYENGAFIWDMCNKQPYFFQQELPLRYQSEETKTKMIAELKFEEADFIISKKDYKRKTKEELLYFLSVMKGA